jgi:hypothetical protein
LVCNAGSAGPRQQSLRSESRETDDYILLPEFLGSSTWRANFLYLFLSGTKQVSYIPHALHYAMKALAPIIYVVTRRLNAGIIGGRCGQPMGHVPEVTKSVADSVVWCGLLRPVSAVTHGRTGRSRRFLRSFKE